MTAPAWPFLYSVRAGRIVRNVVESALPEIVAVLRAPLLLKTRGRG